MKTTLRLAASALVVVGIAAAYFVYRQINQSGPRGAMLMTWLRAPGSHPDWAVSAGQRCGDAPFIQPTDGYIGFLWGDSFRPGHHHQGLDIFGGANPGVTPVYAVYPGYLTRQADWKSSLIIRIPSDPLQPRRQIWTYYTHLASSEGGSFISPSFPPGTQDQFVEAGTLLGYQGNYSGDPLNPTGIHLHFSIVLDNGSGLYRNELEIQNTLDPSPYFNLPLSASANQNIIPVCGARAQ